MSDSILSELIATLRDAEFPLQHLQHVWVISHTFTLRLQEVAQQLQLLMSQFRQAEPVRSFGSPKGSVVQKVNPVPVVVVNLCRQAAFNEDVAVALQPLLPFSASCLSLRNPTASLRFTHFLSSSRRRNSSNSPRRRLFSASTLATRSRDSDANCSARRTNASIRAACSSPDVIRSRSREDAPPSGIEQPQLSPLPFQVQSQHLAGTGPSPPGWLSIDLGLAGIPAAAGRGSRREGRTGNTPARGGCSGIAGTCRPHPRPHGRRG